MHGKLKIFLIGSVIFLAVFFRFWNINNYDVQNDVALNAVRALGWFDFLAGAAQTSPIIWFGSVPAWGFLSFHDHPPLVFIIQRIFLEIFGQSSWAVFLPYLLFNLGAIFLVYFLLSLLRSKTEGLLAAFIFSISALMVWMVKMGYMEGVQILFILLSFAFFLFYLRNKKIINLYCWAVFTGLSLLSKYTAIFLLPAVFLYCLIWDRKVLKDKKIWLSLIIIIIILSPVIFYNIMVFKTRGHFDAALSSMVGMNPSDYSVLKRKLNSNFIDNFQSIFIALKSVSSWGFIMVSILSIVYLVWGIIKKHADNFRKFLFLNIILILAMFSFGDMAPRFISIIIPFLAISISLFVFSVVNFLHQKKILLYIFLSFIVIVLAWETVYSFNVNVLKVPFSTNKIFFSGLNVHNTSFTKLDNYLKDEVYGELPKRKKITKLDDVLNYNLVGMETILFDDRIDWDSSMWYVHRYQAYYDVPIVYISDVLSSAQDENIFNYLIKAGSTGFCLVVAEDKAVVRNNTVEYQNFIDNITLGLEQNGLKPEKEIFDDTGNRVFKIYHFYLRQ